MSKAAQTHKLRKLRAPSKCRECDGLVVFHGAECEEVTLVSFIFLFIEKPKSIAQSESSVWTHGVSVAFSVFQVLRWTLPTLHKGFFITHVEQKSNKNKSRRPPLVSSKHPNERESWVWPQALHWDQMHPLVSVGRRSRGNWRPFVHLLKNPLCP